jgi:hypothetical protein
MFHLFPDQLGADPVLVRSTNLGYATDAPGNASLPAYSLLTSATAQGYLSGSQPLVAAVAAAQIRSSSSRLPRPL